MEPPQHATRLLLLEAALDAFSKKGFDGASIREITRRVNIRESGFYAHFASKREVYDELLEQAAPAVVLRAVNALQSVEDPQEFLTALLQDLIDAAVQPRARRFTALLLRNVFSTETSGRTNIKDSVDDVLAALTERIGAWQAAGSLRSDVGAQQLAYIFMAPLITARLMFFNVSAGPAEEQSGRELLAEHVRAFITLTRNRT
ncbi:MAG: TetR/AcrR family transcriptional regulator [Candidatus Eremiobacteraeota bacterium]|nr:TetR/AcrR family transcriptional regulator [Candidatus Eremiobacteraeota bacterium]